MLCDKGEPCAPAMVSRVVILWAGAMQGTAQAMSVGVLGGDKSHDNHMINN